MRTRNSWEKPHDDMILWFSGLFALAIIELRFDGMNDLQEGGLKGILV